jgi:ADP-ribose pyrophosphatase YjhB (NUDIX family)
MQLTRWQRLRTRAFLFAVGIKRRMTLGTRAMLIEGNKVYLIRHTYMPGWQLPGGGVEPNETAEQSAAREALEETGYRLTGRPQLFAFYHNVSEATTRDHVALYLCREFEKAWEFEANFEIAAFGWFDIDALPPGTTEGTIRRVAEVFHGHTTDPAW